MTRSILSPNRNTSAGFTLLEVMIAITIMTIAFSAILSSQSSAIQLTVKTKELNIAAWLAKNIMVQSEILLEGKPFGELDKSKSESFEAPFSNYKWTREIKEIKFPDFTQPEEKKNGTKEGVTDSMNLLVKTMTKFISDSIREMVVTVTWTRGKGEQRFQVSTYLIDLDAKFDFKM